MCNNGSHCIITETPLTFLARHHGRVCQAQQTSPDGQIKEHKRTTTSIQITRRSDQGDMQRPASHRQQLHLLKHRSPSLPRPRKSRLLLPFSERQTRPTIQAQLDFAHGRNSKPSKRTLSELLRVREWLYGSHDFGPRVEETTNSAWCSCRC